MICLKILTFIFVSLSTIIFPIEIIDVNKYANEIIIGKKKKNVEMRSSSRYPGQEKL